MSVNTVIGNKFFLYTSIFSILSHFVPYLGHTVKRLSRCPYPAADDVFPVTAEDWELHRGTILFKN
jgi:hypothetical protein